jgi:hypothetical protein
MVDPAFRAALRQRVTAEVDCAHVSFVEGSADAWFGTVDLVVYNASGTSFEAVAAGLPAIFVGSEIALDMDKMRGRATLRCRTADELRRHVRDALDDPNVRRTCVAAGRHFLSRCFAAPRSDVWVDVAMRAATGTVA